jgi:glycosyltransferase involved in cell wall biosynthesis
MVNRACRENNADIIHSHIFPAAITSFPVKRKLNIPMVYDMHGMFPDEILYGKSLIKKMRWVPWKIVETILRRKSDFIVATSDSLERMLIKFGMPREKTCSIPVGVNTNMFYPGSGERIRQKYGISDRKVVLYAGGIESYQGIDNLFDAIPHIIRQEPDTVFLIVGGGVEFDMYHKISRNPKLRNNIIMTGYVEYNDIPDYIRSADIGVSLRRASLMGHVSFPTKLTTYMACGIPCIATNNGDQKSIIEKNNVGLLFKSGDSDDLATCVLEALSDTKKLRNMGRISREVVVKEYSWDVLTKKYTDVYDRLLS